MSIKDLINKLKAGQKEKLIKLRVDPHEGVDFIFASKILSNIEKYATENPYFGMQMAYLKGMEEQEKAVKNPDGFTIFSEDIVELGEDFASLFELPEIYSGRFQARLEANTGRAAFKVDIDLLLSDGTQVKTYSLHGPFLKLAENELYSLTAESWNALQAVEKHKALAPDQRGEYENNWLVLQLQIAKKSGMPIDLAHFNNIEIVQPNSVGVSIDVQPSGDILLTPSFGSGIDIEDIKTRLGHILDADGHCIYKVKNKFVLLDEQRLEAAKEILTNSKIPKEQVETFLKSPTAYLNSALIDLEMGFSLRVHGAERFSHRYFGDVEKSGVDWFSGPSDIVEQPELLSSIVDSEEKLNEVELLIENTKSTGAQLVEIDDRVIPPFFTVTIYRI